MKKHLFPLIAVLALFAGLTSCEKDPETIEADAPVLVSSNPASGTNGLAISTSSIVLTYDQNVKCTTASQASISLSGGGSITKVLAYGTDVTISIDALQYGTTYTLNVPAGVVEGYKENQKHTAAVTVSFTTEDEPETPVGPEVPGDNVRSMVGTLGLGWNMGNHMDSFYNWHYVDGNGFDWFDMPAETAWGSPLATQATFDGVKAAGFKSVRIPVTWLRKIGEGPEYKIDTGWMDRVYEIVGYAEKAGLKVIINTHHDECNADGHWLDLLGASRSSATNELIKTEIKAVWTQIADKFKDKGDFLIFESFNELQDGGWGWSTEFQADPSKQCGLLNEWNQVFVDAVRATGGNNATRWLGVPTYAASPEWVSYWTCPSDPANKVMLAVHFYDPYEYTIGDAQYSDWGHTGASGKKANWGDENHVTDTFKKLYNGYVSRGIPVYLGEFGCSMRAKSDTRAWAFYLYYMEYVVKAAKEYGLPCFLWDNGAEESGKEQHGYINHGTGQVIGNAGEVINAMNRAMYTESESYTLDSVYASAPIF